MKIKIKANKALFREWQELSDKIRICADGIEACSNLNHNDRIMEESELIDWKIRVMDLQSYLLELKFITEILMNETLSHIKKYNGPTLKAKAK